MKRDYDEVLSEYGIAAYDEGLSNTKTAMTEREKFAKEYSLHAGISVESIKFDDYGTPYIYTPYVPNVIPNAMVQAAYWGWKAHKAQAVPEGWKLVPVEPTSDQFGGMARDIIQWMRFTESKNQHSDSLVKWLKDMGNEIPAWLYSESEINHLSKHVISKGTIAAIIYKAMLAAAPEQQK